MILENALGKISGLDENAMAAAQNRLDSLTKPLGSLGRLEDLVKQIAGITGRVRPSVDRKVIVIMCADNGVTEEGVSSCPKSVTASVTQNFMRGITGVNILSKHAGAGITVVDIGVDCESFTLQDAGSGLEGILDRKIRRGTDNIAKGPAMSREEAQKAVESGIEIVFDQVKKGVNLLGTGEMGVGNTTTSSAVAAVLTGKPVEMLVGRGAGLADEGLANKINIIKKAIEVNKPDPNDPLDVLAKLGGFDIAGLAGCYIGAAAKRVPILIDGFIASVAALVAMKMKPESRLYMLASHGSAEAGSGAVLKALELEPLLMLGMRLGEGTGAALGFHIVDAAMTAYNKMGTFDDARIEQYKPL